MVLFDLFLRSLFGVNVVFVGLLSFVVWCLRFVCLVWVCLYLCGWYAACYDCFDCLMIGLMAVILIDFIIWLFVVLVEMIVVLYRLSRVVVVLDLLYLCLYRWVYCLLVWV